MHMLEGRSNSMDYVTPGRGTALPEWLVAAISSYDPEHSVVLVFVQDEVFQRASRQAGASLLDEYVGVLSGPAYMNVVTRLPSPPDCSKAAAH